MSLKVDLNPYKKSCQVCLNQEHETTKILSCTRCKLTFYCSKKCQKDDWPTHKKICKLQANSFIEHLEHIEKNNEIIDFLFRAIKNYLTAKLKEKLNQKLQLKIKKAWELISFDSLKNMLLKYSCKFKPILMNIYVLFSNFKPRFHFLNKFANNIDEFTQFVFKNCNPHDISLLIYLTESKKSFPSISTEDLINIFSKIINDKTQDEKFHRDVFTSLFSADVLDQRFEFNINNVFADLNEKIAHIFLQKKNRSVKKYLKQIINRPLEDIIRTTPSLCKNGKKYSVSKLKDDFKTISKRIHHLQMEALPKNESKKKAIQTFFRDIIYTIVSNYEYFRSIFIQKPISEANRKTLAFLISLIGSTSYSLIKSKDQSFYNYLLKFIRVLTETTLLKEKYKERNSSEKAHINSLKISSNFFFDALENIAWKKFSQLPSCKYPSEYALRFIFELKNQHTKVPCQFYFTQFEEKRVLENHELSCEKVQEVTEEIFKPKKVATFFMEECLNITNEEILSLLILLKILTAKSEN